MLDKALQLCEAKFGNIMTYDGENFKFAATAGHSEFDKWLRQNRPGRPEPGTTMDRMIRGERVIHIPMWRTTSLIGPVRRYVVRS